ncbi:hypothetical protein MK079_01145 [Candidatus Gracilibacteria bacterium]|nr:hypothetical protein [Candidatus Gracilibacteria bacterium]
MIEGILRLFLLNIKTHMNLQIKLHTGNDVADSKEVIERIVQENMSNKLDQYLNKFHKEDAEGTIELKVDKNKKGLFDASLHANLDGNVHHFSREDYKNMDDLINHLFDHLKEALSA